jgi:hypothetical protein
VIDQLQLLGPVDPVEHPGYGYADENRSTHACPVCGFKAGEYLLVEFQGETTRARVECSRGCEPAEIAAVLKLELDEAGRIVPRVELALPEDWWKQQP